jgi:AraC-like DNA-binding protein
MRCHVFDDFDAFAAAVRDVESKMLARNPKRRVWSVSSVELGRIDVQVGRLGSGNIAQGQLRADGRMLYLPLTAGIEYAANGIVLSAKSFAVLEPACEFCVSTKVEHDWCTVFIPNDLLAHAEGLEGNGTSGKPACWVTRPNPAAAALFRRTVLQIMQTAVQCPDFETTAASRVAAAEVSQVARSVFGQQGIEESGCTGRPRVSRQQIIRSCMEHLEQQAGNAVTVSDLATTAEVSERTRTVRTAFNEYFGIGPIRYLRLKRLHQIHRALREADPETNAVSSVLVEHGEWDFGRFAAHYRRLFGELPAETLRQRPA